MNYMLYIGVFCLCILIAGAFFALRRRTKRKESTLSQTDITILNDDIKQVAIDLSSEITYSRKEKRVSYKKDINACVNKFTQFYNKFNMDHEESIIMAKTLLDNKFFMERLINSINTMKNEKYTLPVSDDNRCILSTFAKDLISATGYDMDLDKIVSFANSYQKNRNFRYKELCLLLPVIKLELAKDLINHMEYALITSKKYDDCEKMIDSLERGYEYSPEIARKVRKFVNSHAREALSKLYVDVLNSTLVKDEVVKEILDFCSENEINIDEVVEDQQRILAHKAVVVTKIIISLWEIEKISFDEMYVQISPVENLLVDDYTDEYKLMTQRTKEYYRSTISKIADYCKASELEVATVAKEVSDYQKSHIGTAILGIYRDDLYGVLCSKSAPKRYASVGLYKFLSFILMLLILSIYSIGVYMITNDSTISIIACLVFLVPAYLKSTDIAKFIYAKTYKNQTVPMMEFEDHIPDDAKSLVVVPVLGISTDHLKKVLDNLYLVARNNGTNNIVYSLLVDFPSKLLSNDEKQIIEDINKDIARLNDKEGLDFIHALFRKKELNEVTNTYMGKERKRGAVLMLNEFLESGKSSSFFASTLPETLKDVEYVITLDEDTMLLPMEAANLIGSLHHPLNRPIVRHGEIISGVTIMQPKMRTRIYDATRTKFTELYSGEEGYSRYGANNNGVLMNAFGTGLFYGKGIYQPKAFNAILADKFRDNRILSHDIVEGGLAGCYESEATAVEGFPSNIFSYYKRQERWSRGDWQLIPYIFPYVRNKNNKLVRNNIDKMTKNQIFINALQSLNAFALLGSLVLAGIFNYLLTFAVVVFAPFALIFIYNIIKDLILYHRINKDTRNSIQKKCYDFLVLPYKAYVEFSAAFRAVFRMLFAKHKLLQWSTAAQSNHRKDTFFGYAKEMSANLIMSLVFVFLAGLNSTYAVYNITIAFAFFSSVFVTYTINTEEEEYDKIIHSDDESFLKSLLKKTYRYFEDFTDEETGLVCDNYQKYDNVGCATRTSPTNIGMGLISHIIALEEEYIDSDNFTKRVNKTITTLENMDKFRGHIFNWVNTKTAKPIGSRYISSVDSGNLKMGLRVLCRYLDEKDISRKDISQRAKKLADDMDFSFLYDDVHKLFFIGFNLDDGCNCCESRYDMYMSEARQMSLLEVAENNVSIKHWMLLSRELVNTNPPAMKSWSGSTFEYLMPYIFIGMEKNTLEYTSLENYVYLQQRYCTKQGIPFGISESGYFDFDTSLNYQYKSFGVPSTSNKRGVEGELVCSPYSAGLILDIAPSIAMRALREYDEMGLAGSYGFYEAVDFTMQRLKKEQPYEIVQSYMAHHQGMMMCGIYNYLNDGFLRNLFMSIDNIRALKEIINEPIVKPDSKKNKPIEFAKRAYRPPSLADTIGVYTKKQKKQIYCQSMSNGKYHLNINSKGFGYSTFEDNLLNSITDKDRNLGGIFAVLKEDDNVYEFIHSESNIKPLDESFVVNINSVIHNSTYENLNLSTMVYVSQYENTEVRKYTIENNTDIRRNVKLYIYSDIALCQKNRYLDHRAFQNLFVTSKVDNDMLTFTRRKREEEDPDIAMSWKVVAEDDYFFPQYGNDAELALGRYRKLHNALMLENPVELSETTIYPAAAATIEVSLPPNSTRDVYLLQSAGETVEECKNATKSLISKYQIDNDYNLSYAKIKASYKFANLSNKHIVLMNKMLPMILYSKDLQKTDKSAVESNTRGIESLWKFGISGDRPIVLAELDNFEQIMKIEHLLNVQKYFYYTGIKFDLVLLNRDITGYDNVIQQQLFALRNAYVLNDADLKDHIKILNINSVDYSEAALIHAVAKCTFNCNTPFTTQTKGLVYRENNSNKVSTADDISDITDLAMYNTIGGFDIENEEYVIKPSGQKPTPVPWCNILTNSRVGVIVSEKGISYMWYENSREVPLLPWRNDPIKDICGVRLNIEDVSYNKTLMTLGTASYDSGEWKVRHGIGYSIFQKEQDNVKVSVSMFISLDNDCFIQIVNITNMKHEDMQVSIDYESDITVGSKDAYFVLNKDIGSGILSKNCFSETLKDKLYYQLIVDDQDRELQNLDGVYDKKTRSNIKRKYQLFAQKGITFAILSGVAKDEVEASRIYQDFDVDSVINMFDNTVNHWKKRVCPIKVITPDEKLNIMTNGFLLYQTQVSRIFGRCGYYQCGGAFGFRDQLQDSLAMLYVDPTFTRDMLVEFAAHQFIGGDVQHWWHKPARGVRTKIRDDMLFMPYVLCKYINYTKDISILDEEINYLESVEIPEGHDDWYGDAKQSNRKGSMQEHCLKAISCAYSLGQNGLPLMHGGDWNDGMNKVGIKGTGESVWLGFFLYDVLVEFSQVLMDKNQFDLAEELQERAIKLKKSLNENGWDGKWFKRAFYDDGTPLGSKENNECKIDCISQSWAVISDVADNERGNMCMNSVRDILFDKENKIIKLLSPSFENDEHNPGYIKGYIKGVRENGGQYTHGAIWAVKAMAYLGRGKDAYTLLDTINPISHSMTKEDAEIYKAEPYVVCADVYSSNGQEGRGGWTWYTGSSAWLYNVIIQDILGIKIIKDKLIIYPCISPKWDKFTVEFDFEGTSYTINIKNSHKKESGIASLMMDGKELKSNSIELFHDKKHHKLYGNM